MGGGAASAPGLLSSATSAASNYVLYHYVRCATLSSSNAFLFKKTFETYNQEERVFFNLCSMRGRKYFKFEESALKHLHVFTDIEEMDSD